MSQYQAAWMAPPELQRTIDETAFELIELLWADQRGWAGAERWRELATALRTLAEELDHHAGKK